MKTIYSFIAISLISISSMACPNLTGEWNCKSSQGETVKMNLNSINKDDYNMLMVVSDVGTKVQTTEALTLNVGKQQSRDYSYRANCKRDSIVIDFETVLGPVTVVYTSLGNNEMLMSSSNKKVSNDKVMTCSKFSLLD